jgi:predicted nucleotidyltransferase
MNEDDLSKALGRGQTPKAHLIQFLVQRFSAFDTVEAIAVAGSSASGASDQHSDIDLYVYSTETILLAARTALVAERGASRTDLNLQFWDPGDEWFDAATGIEVDVMYWDPAWVEGQLNRVWREHQASLGYTTCLWHTVRNSRALYDRRGWFDALQQHSAQPYPEPLRQAIIAKNHAVLRNVIPSYAHQIEKASRRVDRVSQNHRVAALLASYFDVVFALNRALHPGEKRLVAWAQANCATLPVGMAESIEKVLQASYQVDGSLLAAVYALIDSLDDLLWAQGFDPTTSQPFA